MASRRDQIRMSEEELRSFLEQTQTLILCSRGPDDVPHPMPMWWAFDDAGAVVMTTFARSQKVRNLERDPRCSLLAEDGTRYEELRGAVLYGSCELDPDPEAVVDALSRVTAKNTGGGRKPESLRDAVRPMASKRVALRVRPERVVSWDHRKLGGRY